MLEELGIQMWLPEAGGPIEVSGQAHRVLMTVLGAQSQREVLRSRHRVLAAMQAQVVEQGRYLGGRPPYGYRLVDAGPHPNRAHARWGRRLQRLDPDPICGPFVRWMFEQRLAGRSVAGIARELNERGIPCPSDVDPGRNRHREGGAWTLQTVAVILANPRYTGRQVWNRHTQVRREHRGRDAALASRATQAWTMSKVMAHPPLVSEAQFVAAQQVRAARPAKDGSTRDYLLAGLVRCGLCGRRMDSHWVHGRAGYRCRHGHNSARPRQPGQPRNLYVREDVLLAQLIDHVAAEPIGQDLVRRTDGDVRKQAAAVVSCLQARVLMVVHDDRSWRLAADG